MRIEHVAIWTQDLERLKTFYEKYFNCKSNEKYINKVKQFESYFLEFDSGTRLEIMSNPLIAKNKNNTKEEYIGFIHIAISVGSSDKVDSLTNQLRNDGFEVISEPRLTGDGYYESCILDPDGHRIEITE